MMPKVRDPNRERAFEIYKKHDGFIDLVEIASQLNLPDGTIRGWKSKDKWEQPYATNPMQDFCDVSHGGRGLSVMAAGIYEYECTDNAERALALTLVRSNNIFGGDNFARTPAFNLKEAQAKGEITYTLALFPHDGDWRVIYPSIRSALNPVIAVLKRDPEDSVLIDYIPPEICLPDTGSAVRLNGKNLMITACKHAEERNSMIVRIFNYGNEYENGSISFGFGNNDISAVYETGLDEKRLNKLNYNGVINFGLRAAGLMTFEVEFMSGQTKN
jgi:alpha-mannosidase